MKYIIGGLLLLSVGVGGWWLLYPTLVDVEVADTLSPELTRLIENTDQTTGNVLSLGPFPITATPSHPATGTVRVINTPKTKMVRFENYHGTNGPDLFVYLAKDLNANEFVSLGRARGNRGDINYTVPAEVDVNEYQYVLTWCRAFGVLFDYATIN